MDKTGAPVPRQELRYQSPTSTERRHEPSSKNSLDQPALDSAIPVSSRSSLEPSQTDLEGQYVGPSSGVAFLLRAQRRLHEVVTLSPNSSIFTFGDSPLPEYDPSFFVLPPEVMRQTWSRDTLTLPFRRIDFYTNKQWSDTCNSSMTILEALILSEEQGRRMQSF